MIPLSLKYSKISLVNPIIHFTSFVKTELRELSMLRQLYVKVSSCLITQHELTHYMSVATAPPFPAFGPAVARFSAY
jgi:hypothetical protein